MLVVVAMCLAAYLYASALLIENDCFLAGDRSCPVAVRRVWMAAAVAACSLLIGVAAVVFARRADSQSAGR